MYFSNNQNGNFVNRLSNFRNFQEQLAQFKQQLDSQGNVNYEQIVQNLINSGQMSQEQFNQFRTIANQLTGLNK